MSRNFKFYLKPCTSKMNNNILTAEELKTAFKTLLSNKNPGVDEVSVNVLKKVFHIIEPALLYTFNESLSEGIFPDLMKVAKITPILKSGDKLNIANFRPISVLPCFSKILERLICNRLYKYLTNNNFLYKKQFSF